MSQAPPTIQAALGRKYVSPIAPGSIFQGIDQGADYKQTAPYRAIAPGTVTGLGSGWHGGTGRAVYYKFDQPVTVGGRTYPGAYVSETTPLVHPGAHVAAGQPIASGGGAELGFAAGNSPYAPLSGGYNAEGGHSTKTQAGYDFNSIITGQKPLAAVLGGHIAASGGSSVGGGATAGPVLPAVAATPVDIRALFARTIAGAISPSGQLDNPMALNMALQTLQTPRG